MENSPAVISPASGRQFVARCVSAGKLFYHIYQTKPSLEGDTKTGCCHSLIAFIKICRPLRAFKIFKTTSIPRRFSPGYKLTPRCGAWMQIGNPRKGCSQFSLNQSCNYSLYITGFYVILIKLRKGTRMQKLDARRQPQKGNKQVDIPSPKLFRNVLSYFKLFKRCLGGCLEFSEFSCSNPLTQQPQKAR